MAFGRISEYAPGFAYFFGKNKGMRITKIPPYLALSVSEC